MLPAIETARLLLRPLARDDLDAYAEFWRQPEVVRFITGTPFSREESWKKLLRTVGHWHVLGFGFFAIEERQSGRFIGEAGFQEMLRELTPSIEGTLEAGWGIHPAFQGRGYALEAMGAAMAWADGKFPQSDYSCIISPANEASLHIAQRLGFAGDRLAEYLGKPVRILRRASAGTRAGF